MRHTAARNKEKKSNKGSAKEHTNSNQKELQRKDSGSISIDNEERTIQKEQQQDHWQEQQQEPAQEKQHEQEEWQKPSRNDCFWINLRTAIYTMTWLSALWSLFFGRIGITAGRTDVSQLRPFYNREVVIMKEEFKSPSEKQGTGILGSRMNRPYLSSPSKSLRRRGELLQYAKVWNGAYAPTTLRNDGQQRL